MEMQRLLIVEDDPSIQKILRDYLSVKGWRVCAVSDGTQAVELLEKERFGMVLLDVMIPGMDGFEVCRKIRTLYRKLPVIFLTALEEERMQLAGYECGADDYVTKPFSLPVLYAKVQALSKRYDGEENGEYWCGKLTLDTGSRLARVEGRLLELPEKEYRMLECFVENEGRILSRNQILDLVWGDGAEVLDRLVDKHIVKLRKKLGAAGEYIKTVPKAGYVFDSRGNRA